MGAFFFAESIEKLFKGFKTPFFYAGVESKDGCLPEIDPPV